MAKKKKANSAPSDFETQVVVACLAEKLVRGGYGADPSDAAITADIEAWRKHARTASAAMSHKSRRAR
jgi:hypothetical protein